MTIPETINWKQDLTFQRWIGTITRKSTKRSYLSRFKTYIEFTGLTPFQLIDEALEDQKRDPREKQDIVLRHLIDFYNWLKTDYQKRKKGKGKQKALGKGVTDKVAHARIGTVRSFYATFGITVRMKGRHSLPRPKVTNKRMIVNAEQVKILLNHARTPRDRAIMLSHFQGGMDASTVCSVNYGDVKKGLENNEHPLKIDLYRPKTGIEYYTFLGKDAVTAIKAYISDMESRGVTFTHNTPLFLKERGKAEGITTNLIQNMMRTVAHNSEFIDDKNNGKAFNPLGPHALRESFGSIMINSGVPDTIVDFWLGHAIGEMAEAYKGVQFESLKEMYLEREKLLSVSGPKVDVEEIKQKVRVEVEQQNRQLQLLVNGLTTENLELKRQVSDNTKKLEELEKELPKIEELIKVLKDSLNSNK